MQRSRPAPRAAHRTYFDYFDHRLAFTHKGMAEGLAISGFSVVRAIGQFLPDTTKSRLPQHPALVALYLRVPLAWRLLGGQMLLVARPVRSDAAKPLVWVNIPKVKESYGCVLHDWS
jgi:hypothetical protein